MIEKNTPLQAMEVYAPIDGRIMFSNPRIESILLTLVPGETIPPHTNPFDVLFIGMSGDLTLSEQESEVELSALETAFVAAGKQRQLHNPGSQKARVMVIKIL